MSIPSRIIEIDPRRLRLLSINARFMPHEVFQRLVANIKRDGVLTQIPFAWHVHSDDTAEPLYDDEGEPIYEVIGGNHRTKAAIEAGLDTIHCIVTEEYLEPQHRIAMQLSHNAIEGEDDPSTLRHLYSQLSVDWRKYSGLDDKTLQLLQSVQIESLGEANLSFQTMAIMFLPDELEQVREVFERARKTVRADDLYLAPFAAYDTFMDTLDIIGASYNVKNIAATLMAMLALVERHFTELQEGWTTDHGESKHSNLVPLAAIFGSTKVPARVALVVQRAVQQLIEQQDIDPLTRWAALETWAYASLGEEPPKKGKKKDRAK